ncbi:MAG: Na/Pi cotransporter family protein [bacterium]|nr:Na/Pi cotransporter family protein [bacterium]
MLFMVIGGLGIFLIGMKHMSDGIQGIAGNRLRKMINAVTDNRFKAVGVGIGVTMFVQSSSITTVLVVGFVNSGLMALHQAIGVIMGSNIGTTFTGWILVMKVGKYGLPTLGLSAFFYLFSKRDGVRLLAMALMGLGMVFFGLELMKNGFKPMRYLQEFREAFQYFDATSGYFGVLKCAAVGCVLTFLVQSSSATLAITIGLAQTGAIPFETAAALVLGENIGTTITAWLASIGANTTAKRAAYAHVFFNLFGVFWITALFTPYMHVVNKVLGSGLFVKSAEGVDILSDSFRFSEEGSVQYALIIAAAIATTHTLFNVINTTMFVGFLKPYARFLERLIPKKEGREVHHLTTLDFRLVESPVMAIANSRKEISNMASGVDKMMAWAREVIASPTADQDLVRKTLHRETVMDTVQTEVINFLTEILSAETPMATTLEARRQLRIADEYESLSDYISMILKAKLRLEENELSFSEAQTKGLLELHDKVATYVRMVSAGFDSRKTSNLARAVSDSESITHLVKNMRNDHLESLSQNRVDPTLSMGYSTVLNGYRKVKDHALNVAESLG